jgi:glycerol-3-phosphate O-acyltransferase
VRPLDEIYTVQDDRRPRLAYYRNNAIHLFVAEGLVALALSGAAARGLVERPELRSRTLRLSRLLKREFSYRVGEPFETIFDQTLGGLISAGLLVEDAEGVHAALGEEELLALLAGQVADFVESYLIAARGVEALTAPLGEKELVKRIHDLGEKLFFTGEVRRREACVRASYENAVHQFRERKILVEESGKLRLALNAEPKQLVAEIADLLG